MSAVPFMPEGQPLRVDRQALVDWYRRNRQRTAALFDLLDGEDTCYSQPVALRHPPVFYEGHLPAFSFNTLIKKALGRPGVDASLESLFARGIDPEAATASSSPDRNRALWPDRRTIRAFAAEADARVLDALIHADLDQPGHPLLDRGEAAFAILEHEAMHHETMLYMWHRLPFDQKRRPVTYRPRVDGPVPRQQWVDVPAGEATLGVDRGAVLFAWDNECGPFRSPVPAFAIEQHDVTNDAFMAFVEAGGYATPDFWTPDDWHWLQVEGITHPLFWERADGNWYWRGMFELIDLPPSWPVFVSHAEAAAYARWRGARLPTEAEYARAAHASPLREHRRIDRAPAPESGVFDFSSWDPEPAGSHPSGRSAWGIDDLVGNGWEWTSTPFAPFPGFEARASYPEYSADFFDNQHFVMKGASPATARELVRSPFRNWFRSRYPYVYATFRCARDGGA